MLKSRMQPRRANADEAGRSYAYARGGGGGGGGGGDLNFYEESSDDARLYRPIGSRLFGHLCSTLSVNELHRASYISAKTV